MIENVDTCPSVRVPGRLAIEIVIRISTSITLHIFSMSVLMSKRDVFLVLVKRVKSMGMFYQLWWEENSNSDKSGCFGDDIICSGTHLLSVLTTHAHFHLLE